MIIHAHVGKLHQSFVFYYSIRSCLPYRFAVRVDGSVAVGLRVCELVGHPTECEEGMVKGLRESKGKKTECFVTGLRFCTVHVKG